MSLKDCFLSAAKMGVISREEAKQLGQRFDEIAATTTNTAEAKARMAKEIEAEAKHRERAALLTEIARSRIVDSLQNYRTGKGQTDMLQGWLAHHEYVFQDTGGSFVQDAEMKRETIIRKAHADLRQVMQELHRGMITGDLRRTSRLVGSRKVMARMDNMVRELFGESTGDATAAAMARAWEKVSEDMRVRFNAAGGSVAKLERWGLPQSHDPLALLDAGRDRWVQYMMQDGVLDRERTVHSVSRERLSDPELKRALEAIWEKITTDGWSNKDVTAQPQGKGAIYTQHADHRFLHFKGADAWLKYSREFGNADPFAAIMGHVSTMARDIAHMEVFGPNPNATREWMKSWLRSQAAKQRPTDILISDAHARLKDLNGRMGMPNPEYQRLAGEAARVATELQAALDSKGGRAAAKYTRELMAWEHREAQRQRLRPSDAAEPRPEPPKADADVMATVDRLSRELADVERQMGDTAKGMANPEVTDEMARIFEDMREPITVKEGTSAERIRGVVDKAIARADAMWDSMRGEAPTDPVLAHRLQSARNFISASSLGSAWLSSLNDPAFGMDMRMRIGMGMAKANFGRLLGIAIKEMVTRMSREEAVAAGLGLDSAMQVLRRQASEIKSIDHRFWTGWMADRTLTWGLLSPWTQAGKHMAGLDLMRYMAKLAPHALPELPRGLQEAFKRHGIDAAAWDQIRASPQHEGLIRPTEIEAAGSRDLAERYLQAILRETRYAVPEATVRSRSTVTTLAPAGTILGEMARSMGQFKGFSIAVLMLHGLRIAREVGAAEGVQKGRPLAFGGALLITSTFLGAVAMALKDVKDGRDPRRWFDERTWLDPKHWGAAFLQAGGAGILGDLLFADTTRQGKGLESTIAGPLVGRVSDVGDLLIGEPMKMLAGKKTNFAAKAVKVLRQNVPFANHWLLSAVYQHTIMDQLQRIMDPEAYAGFQRERAQRRKDYGQEYFFGPGDRSPQRWPNVSRTLATH